MSVLDGSSVIVGQSATPANNYKISAPDDGTLLIQKNPSSPTTVVTIDANGKVWGGRLLGFASTTTPTTGITTNTDLIGLSVTVNVLAGQMIKIEGHGYTLASSVLTDFVVCAIYEGANPLNYWQAQGTGSPKPVAILSPTAGSHTYKLVAYRTGTGTASTNPAGLGAFISVEAL